VDPDDEIDAAPSWGDDPTPLPSEPETVVLFDQDLDLDPDRNPGPPAGPGAPRPDPYLATTSPVAWDPEGEPTRPVDAAEARTQRADGPSEPPWSASPEDPPR
jgi:hypothetical protein